MVSYLHLWMSDPVSLQYLRSPCGTTRCVKSGCCRLLRTYLMAHTSLKCLVHASHLTLRIALCRGAVPITQLKTLRVRKVK